VRRRESIGSLIGTAVAWPLAGRAQQMAMPVIGYLNTRAPNEDAHLLAAFRQGLTETGYVDGRNVTIEYRWAEGRNDRLPALAADLVRHGVSVIAANSQAAVAAKAATTTIPIVFVTSADPVQVGFVASLGRPGGNLTGVTSLDMELGPKRLQLMHELLPKAETIAALINPTFPGSDIQLSQLQAAASTLRWVSCTRAPNATSRRPSRHWPDCKSAESWSATIHFSIAGASSSPPWRSATPCPRSMHFASSRRPAD
jgi:putative ABC transport system substrate-binding protein